MTERRPRVLVLNQYYWPGVEATAHLLSELCAELTDEFDITVVTGLLSGSRTDAGQVEYRGVKIVRVRSTAYERSRVSRRAANYLTYLVQSVRAGLAAERPDERSIVLIADLAGAEQVSATHVAEAIQYRRFDRHS